MAGSKYGAKTADNIPAQMLQLADGTFLPAGGTDNGDGTAVPLGGGGGGGGAVTVADGADATQGAKADAAVSNPASSGSVIALLKGIITKLAGNLAVTGTFWQATQPVSIATAPALVAGGASIGGTKDNGPQWTPVRKSTTSADMTTQANISVAPTSGQKIYLDDLLVSSDTAMYVDIKEESDASTVFARIYLSAGGSAQFTPRDGLKLATADKMLQMKASVAGNLAVWVAHHSEA